MATKKKVAYRIEVMEDGELVPVDLRGKKLKKVAKNEDLPPVTMQTLSFNMWYCNGCVCYINGRRYWVC